MSLPQTASPQVAATSALLPRVVPPHTDLVLLGSLCTKHANIHRRTRIHRHTHIQRHTYTHTPSADTVTTARVTVTGRTPGQRTFSGNFGTDPNQQVAEAVHGHNAIRAQGQRGGLDGFLVTSVRVHTAHGRPTHCTRVVHTTAQEQVLQQHLVVAALEHMAQQRATPCVVPASKGGGVKQATQRGAHSTRPRTSVVRGFATPKPRLAPPKTQDPWERRGVLETHQTRQRAPLPRLHARVHPRPPGLAPTPRKNHLDTNGGMATSMSATDIQHTNNAREHTHLPPAPQGTLASPPAPRQIPAPPTP